MDRITVEELCELIAEGRKLLILDVRPKEVRAREGIIPGAVPADPVDIVPVVTGYSRESDVVVYCACPNEASAATAAKQLKQAGFKKIRPLLGGIDAWVGAGHALEHPRAGVAERTQGLEHEALVDPGVVPRHSTAKAHGARRRRRCRSSARI